MQIAQYRSDNYLRNHRASCATLTRGQLVINSTASLIEHTHHDVHISYGYGCWFTVKYEADKHRERSKNSERCPPDKSCVWISFFAPVPLPLSLGLLRLPRSSGFKCGTVHPCRRHFEYPRIYTLPISLFLSSAIYVLIALLRYTFLHHFSNTLDR